MYRATKTLNNDGEFVLCGYAKLDGEGKAILFISLDDGNRHYQEFLTWVAEGNTPEPADE